jgi:hypothetical protein
MRQFPHFIFRLLLLCIPVIQNITMLPSSKLELRSCSLADRQFNISCLCISHVDVEYYLDVQTFFLFCDV